MLFFFHRHIGDCLKLRKLILGKEQLILAEVIGVLQAIAAAGEAVLLVVLNFILPVLFQKISVRLVPLVKVDLFFMSRYLVKPSIGNANALSINARQSLPSFSYNLI